MPDRNNVIAQGLSSGWGDTYDYYRFEQWIDLGQGTLADGTYVLRSVSDPQNLVYESPSKADAAREGSADNSAITTFVVSRGRSSTATRPSGTVTINHVDRSTSTGAVSLDVLGRDDVSGVRAIRVSNDGNSWRTYSNTSFGSIPQTISWDLTDPSAGGSNHDRVAHRLRPVPGQHGQVEPADHGHDLVRPAAPPPPPTSAYGRAVAADRPVGWWRLGDTSGTTAVDQMAVSNGAYARRERRSARRRSCPPRRTRRSRSTARRGYVSGPGAGGLQLHESVLAGGVDQANEPALQRRLPLGADEGGVLLVAVQRAETRVHRHPERHAPPPADAQRRDRRRRHLPRRRHVRRHDSAPLRQRHAGRLRRPCPARRA